MALDAWAAIPDGIEAISAYRVWRYVLEGRGASLHALGCYALEDCPWTPGGWVTARCSLDGGHVAPQEGCTCGFYGMKTLAAVFAVPFLIGEGNVVGRVEFAGRIVEHELGYRAGRAKVAELMAMEGQIPEVMRVANRLGLPMGPLLRSG
jgi:hypothetical protein